MVIVRLLRGRVNFVSSLPRRGHVVACPSCQGILSVELGGHLFRDLRQLQPGLLLPQPGHLRPR